MASFIIQEIPPDFLYNKKALRAGCARALKGKRCLKATARGASVRFTHTII